MAASFRERLQLDEASGAWFDQSRRYMLIRPEALMGVFRRLDPPARRAALDALQASIFEQGSDSARAYMAMGGTGEALLDVIAASAPQLGWGRWSFEATGERLTLTVENSPFAAGYGPSDGPVCAAIAGMVGAVATLTQGRSMTARETACMAAGAPACRFEAVPEGPAA